jgi:hypothetical protein
MAAVLIGAAGAAALAIGAFNIANKKEYTSNTLSDAPYVYEDQLSPRKDDPYEFKHTMYEDRHGSPGYEDQNWQLDCSSKQSCMGFRTPGDGITPFGVQRPPMWGQVEDRTVRDEGTHEPGSYIDDIQMESDRDASTELELPPEHTVNYTSHPLDWGGQLSPEEIPYGASEATDLEFWGPENWDAYRHSKRPTYLDNGTNYKNGKEINRPLDDFGPPWDESEGGPGAHQWGLGSGEFTARDATPRLLARNLYGSHVTTREFERPKFLPPTPGAGIGGGNPGLEPEVTFGERVNRLFAAFMPWKAAMPGTLAPPDFAENYLDKSRKLLYDPGLGVAAARGSTKAFGGPGVNPVQGGRIRNVDDSLTLPQGNAKAKIAARGTLSINPYEGYHYTSRETMEGPSVGQRSQGGNGFLLLGPYEEYRPRKVPDDLQEYTGPRGGAKTGTYGGEAAQGVVIPNLKSDSMETKLTIGGRGGHGQLGKAGIITLGHNTAIGTRGGDYDDSPIPKILRNQTTPLAISMEVGGRTQRSLDDLFDVEHS